ncbi:MAG: PspA/IM30 family protein [Planctomycetota bacterium]
MGIFKRLSDIIQANVNALLDKASDPLALADQMVRELEGARTRVCSAAARAVARQRIIEDDIVRMQRSARQWHERADWAVQRGDDVLARRALVQKNAELAKVPPLEEDLVRAREHAARLQHDLSVVDDRLGQARRRLEQLRSGHETDRAREVARRAVETFDAVEQDQRLEALEQDVRSRQFELQALEDIDGRDISLERTFEQARLEEAVDDELDAMKKSYHTGDE